MIRSSIRALLNVAGEAVATELRGVLKRNDDYGSAGKPVCDWDDETACEALVDALARDAYAVIALLDGQELSDRRKASPQSSSQPSSVKTSSSARTACSESRAR